MPLPVKAGPRPSGVTLTWSKEQIAMIRRSCAKDANNVEFDHFISMCRHLHLNPMSKQAYCIIYSKDNEKYRKAAFIVGIDGYRAVAQRSGDYMPGETTWEMGAKEKELNPLGIVSATVSVKKFAHGSWHEFKATAFWDEYRPLVYDTKAEAKVLSPKWAEMGRHMLAKCAEALALRKGWPELFSGTHTPEEWDREIIDAECQDITPSEAAEQADQAKRIEFVSKKSGGAGVIFVFEDEAVNVPYGEIHARIDAFVANSDPVTIVNFASRNAEGLRQFWAHDNAAALDIKRKIEAAQKKLDAEVSAAEQSFNGNHQEAQA